MVLTAVQYGCSAGASAPWRRARAHAHTRTLAVYMHLCVNAPAARDCSGVCQSLTLVQGASPHKSPGHTPGGYTLSACGTAAPRLDAFCAAVPLRWPTWSLLKKAPASATPSCDLDDILSFALLLLMENRPLNRHRLLPPTGGVAWLPAPWSLLPVGYRLLPLGVPWEGAGADVRQL